MNFIVKTALAVALAFAAVLPTVAQETQQETVPRREHRAIWMSPMLSKTWPEGQITNVESAKRSIADIMSMLNRHGINCVYYHVRANCDATYKSSYEPYASGVAGSRGGTPAGDPFGILLEAAHAHGIEVYAWVNPYRYSSGKKYGAGELNYENSHPDWLITTSDRIFLNPAIPAVQDRIEAVIKEIASNYDIDGMIFDDYFYAPSTPMDLDAEQYEAYKAGKKESEILDQAAWRRALVNETVDRARRAVKAARPYAVFCIGPAGKISPPDIADYGLEPAPFGDMQYTSLHADPIKWLANGWLDFLSPQVYWLENYEALVDWYCKAVPHFGRHLYTSVDCSRLSGGKALLFADNIRYSRRGLRPNENGVVFFDYGAYRTYQQKYEGTYHLFGDILASTVFTSSALQPLHPWRGAYKPATVSNLRREGSKLVWDGPADRAFRRYAVYAVASEKADASYAPAPADLQKICYTESFDLPQGSGDVKYAVAVYDRYGYEYAPVLEGISGASAQTPELLAPASGVAVDLFDFKWKGQPGRYIVEVSKDADFSSFEGMAEADGQLINSHDVANLTAGQTYYWRVRLQRADGSEALSKAQSFEASRISITAPVAGATVADEKPVITWDAAEAGAEYTVEISTYESFNSLTFSQEVGETTSVSIPEKVLSTGRKYFVRVVAKRAGATSISPIVSFAVANVADYDAPAITVPSADGVTLFCDNSIEVSPWSGLSSVTVQVSTSSSFPVRGTTYTGSLANFDTATPNLETFKLGTKTFVDGTTYYVRTRGTYYVDNVSKNTAYGPVRSFVYSSQSGVGTIGSGDGEAYIKEDVLYLPEGAATVTVVDVSGRTVMNESVAGQTELSLAGLAAGAYIIRVEASNISILKWVK